MSLCSSCELSGMLCAVARSSLHAARKLQPGHAMLRVQHGNLTLTGSSRLV